MNGKDIFCGLEYIGSDLIEEAETGKFTTTARPGKHRLLLIAALVAMMLMLVGCAVVYLLKMEDVKIAETTEDRQYRLVDGTYVEDPHEVSQSVLTLAGLKGSTAYQACADFYAYLESQDTINTQAEKEKMAELAESYGLTPQGEILQFRTVRNLCDALGIDRFFRETEGITTDINWGGANENGNISLILNIQFSADVGYGVNNAIATLRWNWKDCFSSDYIVIDDTGDWTEKHYTTTSGNDILMLYSPSNEFGYLLCDRGDALMSLTFPYRTDAWSQVDDKVWADSTYMTEDQMELMAETVDFNIQPKRVTQADVDAQHALSQALAQNGWTLKLKDADTDGYVAHILVSVTAPEGTMLEDESIDNIRTGNGWNISPADGRESLGGDGGGLVSVEDGDGLSNTIDLSMEVKMDMLDGSVPFGIGSQWKISIVDLICQMAGDPFNVTSTLVEGEWTFTITFDETNGDYQELDFVTEPFTAKGSIGWKEDGSDVLQDYTITSLALRKYSSTIDYTEKQEYVYPDFYSYNGKQMCAVMQDGSQVILFSGTNSDTIDLDQVAYLKLPDGTCLKPVE